MTLTSRDGSFTGQREADEQEQTRLMDSPEPNHVPDVNSACKVVSTNGASNEHPRRIEISRPVINQNVISDGSTGGVSRLKTSKFLKKHCSPRKCIYSLLPISYWLPRYNWRRDLSFDFAAGFTVAVMQIPQGMAYALLGNLPPIVGIYMAFFPVIVYACMGTSRHVSMGTFAVICLMTGKVTSDKLLQYIQVDGKNTTSGIGNQTEVSHVYLYDEVEIVTALSLCVGIWQVLMGIFRLGSLSLLLSGEVVSAFTTGCAVHVLTSQFKNLLGIAKMTRRSGVFKIPLTFTDVIGNLLTSNSVNLLAIAMSAITILVLFIYNEFLKNFVTSKIHFPLPMELFTIIVATLISSHWNFGSNYNVTTVDNIPKGIPPPKMPPIQILPDLLLDGLTISIVAYAISISMSKIFAIKHRYDLDSNQELIAQGASNIVGGFFSCAPISVSLSRSVVQESIGGRTQVAGLFTSSIIFIVLLWIGPFFQTLPNCVLSGIIVVALKGMFMQFLDLPKAWKDSPLNAAIWVITFTVTVMLDIEYGLAIGILLSIAILIWRSNKPRIDILGMYSDLDIYVSIRDTQSHEVSGRKIIKYTGNLNFATVEHFVKKIENIVPYKEFLNQKRKEKNPKRAHDLAFQEMVVHWIILDFGSVSSVDPEALRSLALLHKRYENEGIRILLAGCPPSVIAVMNSCKFIKQIGVSNFFPSIHDAVTYSSPIPDLGEIP